MIKRIACALTLVPFVTVYGAGLGNYPIKNHASPQSKTKSLAKIAHKVLAEGGNASSANRFMSQASGSMQFATLSVNSNTLSPNLSIPIVKFNLDIVTPSPYQVVVKNSADTHAPYRLLGKDYNLNIPYLQKVVGSNKYCSKELESADKCTGGTVLTNNYTYYNLYNGETNTLNANGQFFYQRVKQSGLVFSSDGKTVIYSTRTGLKYVFVLAKSSAFEVGNQDKYTNYQCQAIITPKGKVLQFHYDNQGRPSWLSVGANSGKATQPSQPSLSDPVLFTYTGSSIKISYLDNSGDVVSSSLSLSSSGDLIYTNPLNDQTTVSNTPSQMVLTLPTGQQTTLKKSGSIDTVNYLIGSDKRTLPVKYTHNYVNQLTVNYNNNAIQDSNDTTKQNLPLQVNYSVSQDGQNFAGNQMPCGWDTINQLSPGQDALIQCGLWENQQKSLLNRHRLGDYTGYTYATNMTANVPVFDGTAKTTTADVTIINSFNFLHLPISKVVEVNGHVLSKIEHHYDANDTSAGVFTDLSPFYDEPISNDQYQYDPYDLSNTKPAFYTSDNQYYSDSTGGGYVGKLKQLVDTFAREKQITYFDPSKQQNPYLDVPKSVKDTYYNQDGGMQVITRQNTLSASKPWVSNTIIINGNTPVKIAFPQLSSVESFYNGNILSQHHYQYDLSSQPGSLLYGLPTQSSLKAGANGNTLTTITSVAPASTNALYKIDKTVTTDESPNDVYPVTKAGVIHYVNPYGGLVYTQNPVTGTEVYYTYNKNNQIKQITVYPGGKNNPNTHPKIYNYTYQMTNATGQGGYSVTETERTNTYHGKPYVVQNDYLTSGQLYQSLMTFPNVDGLKLVLKNDYNVLGRLIRQHHYHYYQKSSDAPVETQDYITRYFYNADQKLVAVQHPDGSTDVKINDVYNHRVFNYHLSPTNEPAGSDSLCFNPLLSEPSACEVKAVSVSQTKMVDISGPGSGTGQYFRTGSIDYSIILDPNYSYQDDAGQTHQLYAGGNALLNDLLAGADVTKGKVILQQGHALSVVKLRKLADNIQANCSSGSQTCQAGAFMEYAVDSQGRLIDEYSPISHDGASYAYNNNGLPASKSLYVQTHFDANNKTFDNKPISTHYYGYDNNFNLAQLSISGNDSPEKLVAKRQFSALGYLLTHTNILGKQTHDYYYTQPGIDQGQLKSTVDPMGNIKTITYNSVWDLPETVTYAKKKTNFLGQSTGLVENYQIRFTYDDQGFLQSVAKYPAGSQEPSEKYTYTYQPYHNGIATTTVTYADGTSRQYVNQQDNYFNTLSSQLDSTSSHAKNASVNLVNESYSYGPLGVLKQTSYTAPINTTVSYTYNPDLTVQSVNSNNQVKTGIQYNSLGQIDNIDYTLLSSHKTGSYSYQFDRLLRKASYVYQQNGSLLTQLNYTYTPAGQIGRFSCTTNSKVCPKNQNGDVVSSIQYHYNDEWNTLQQVNQVLQGSKTDTQTYHYDSSDPTQLMQFTDSRSGKVDLQYDDNGNVSTETKTNAQGQVQTYHYVYDAGNHLIQINHPSGSSINYQYGPLGMQIASQYQGSTKQYYRLGNIHEFRLVQKNGSAESRYSVPKGSFYNGKFSANITDGYNLTATSDGSALQNVSLYTPYGIPTDITHAVQQTKSADSLALTIANKQFGYRSQQTDELTGWQFLGNGYRAYNPQLRVFMSHDSDSPWLAGINGYNYAGNDPVNHDDPTGHTTMGDLSYINNAVTTSLNKVSSYDAFMMSWGILINTLMMVGTLVL